MNRSAGWAPAAGLGVAACGGAELRPEDASEARHEEQALEADVAADAYLRRVVDCHLARNASMGFAMPEMQPCPLGVKGAAASVATDARGLAVTVGATDAAALAEIDRRGRALTPAAAGR